jgi:hypothetical protein
MNELFTNESSGAINCLPHGGGYLRAAVTAAPNQRSWKTPLGRWSRWTAADDAAWVAEFGRSAKCESCPA